MIYYYIVTLFVINIFIVRETARVQTILIGPDLSNPMCMCV